MKEDSLNITLDEIVKLLEKIEIDSGDKLELMINLNHFLDPKDYENNIKKLTKQLK